MTAHETTALHTRLLKCALEVDDSLAYWQHRPPSSPPASAPRAFSEFWFGARSLPRVEVLLANLRARFDAFPPALEVLYAWSTSSMDPHTRRAICHWHLQLSDPLYRDFTGDFLVTRRRLRPELTRDVVLAWVVSRDTTHRWTTATHLQFASKLLSAAFSAGLLTSTRDPRPLALPKIPDEALAYLLYLLRGLTFAGTLLDNPYLASVGLTPDALEDRLRPSRALNIVQLRRQADLIDLDWAYPDLLAWSRAALPGAHP